MSAVLVLTKYDKPAKTDAPLFVANPNHPLFQFASLTPAPK
jgi:hypothetical protein